jgi:hypothetical protein
MLLMETGKGMHAADLWEPIVVGGICRDHIAIIEAALVAAMIIHVNFVVTRWEAATAMPHAAHGCARFGNRPLPLRLNKQLQISWAVDIV